MPFRRLPPPPDADTVLLPKLTRRSALSANRSQEPRTADSGPDAGAEQPPVRRARADGRPQRYTPHRRRTWVSRGVLAVTLVLQAAMSLHLRNTAAEPEAACLNTGHLELPGLLHGVLGHGGSCHSGSALIYPVLGAAADSAGGLAAARAVSLAAMLGTTALLYSLTRMLFNERIGLLAAVFFAATGSVIMVGNLATDDASALCLLALAAWIVVRSAAARFPGYLAAAPVAVLAVAMSYDTLLYLPSLVALTALAALPYQGRRALVAPVAFAAAAAAVGRLSLLADPGLLAAARGVISAGGQDATWATLRALLAWEAPLAGMALVGTVAYAVRARNEPGELIAPEGGRVRRLALGAVLSGTALLGPMATVSAGSLSVPERVGYGLFFAAPMAGVGMARVIGDHFRRAQLGVAAWAILVTLGIAQSERVFASWPSAAKLIAAIQPYLQPGGRYLVESPAVPMYYLRRGPAAQPSQFISTRAVADVGSPADTARQTVRDGRFRLIVYDGAATPAFDHTLSQALAGDPRYQLASVVPVADNAGSATYYVWVRSG